MIFKRITFLILLSCIITNNSKSDFKEIKKKAIITKQEIIFTIPKNNERYIKSNNIKKTKNKE